jgi:hypothetical protein
MKRLVGLSVVFLGAVVSGRETLLSTKAATRDAQPQFTTLPTYTQMTEVVLVNGRIVYVSPIASEKVSQESQSFTTTSDSGGTGGVAVSGTCPSGETNNFDATCAFDSYQGEPMLASDSSRMHLVGGENDIYPGSCSASASPGTFGDCGISSTVSPSSTSGAILDQNWQRFKLTRNWGGHTFLFGFDPSVTVDNSGNYFAAFGVADVNKVGQLQSNGLAVVTSSDGGASWTKTNPTVLNSNGKQFEDKPWIASGVDPVTLTSNLYVAWTRDKGFNQLIMFSRSTDHGVTWSTPVSINTGISSFERVLYAFPAVATNGTLYVIWYDYARQSIFMNKSTDGGVNWRTSNLSVAATHFTGFSVDIGCNGTRSMTAAPQMAIGADGAIYVVFADVSNTGGPAILQIYIVKSSDGGSIWSTPQLVSGTGLQQYNPAISIDASGNVRVSYLDRRDDPTSDCSTNTWLTTLSSTFATLGNVAVSNATSDFDGNPNGPGDYSGNASLGSINYPYFADHRTYSPDPQTASGGDFEIYSATEP